jgi:O-methyltransferase involved in polyketide biosynthesis
MYLTIDAIHSTLATLATCAPGTRVVLTYNLPKSALQSGGLELDMTIQRFANETGEAFLSLITPVEIEACCSRTATPRSNTLVPKKRFGPISRDEAMFALVGHSG